jgi:hypothetical protein
MKMIWMNATKVSPGTAMPRSLLKCEGHYAGQHAIMAPVSEILKSAETRDKVNKR